MGDESLLQDRDADLAVAGLDKLGSRRFAAHRKYVPRFDDGIDVREIDPDELIIMQIQGNKRGKPVLPNLAWSDALVALSAVHAAKMGKSQLFMLPPEYNRFRLELYGEKSREQFDATYIRPARRAGFVSHPSGLYVKDLTI